MGKTALITGITGQDGSYLAELLLSKGYEVHGIVRRSSTFSTSRIDHLFGNPMLHRHYGDLTDGTGLMSVVEAVMPDEIYNLGAQSHVRVSFDQPAYTVDTVALGTLRMLECAREVLKHKPVRFYQASSSEMFGSSPPPQDESTLFHPRSPYACGKVYAYGQVVNYREAYGLFACNGILFNHECVVSGTPVIIRRRGMIDVVPIEEIVPHREKPDHKRYTTEASELVEVWDRDKWTKVQCMTATWAEDREVLTISSRAAEYSVTPDHVVFASNSKPKKAENLREGDHLTLSSLPEAPCATILTKEEAWLLGALVADGYVAPDGGNARFTKNDETLLAEMERLWPMVTGGTARRSQGVSGYTGEPVKTAELHGATNYGRLIRPELYTETGLKRIPRRILNSTPEIQKTFLEAYNRCDGLKGGHCTYEFKSFTTNSPTLAAGLWWLAHIVLGQRMILCPEHRDGAVYYHINLNSPQEGGKGAHLRRPAEEVVKIEGNKYTGWLFDFATESGTFHAGIGRGWIHNSPRRPENFVTRKITRTAARIKAGLEKDLVLGNLDAKRDWGYAKDYVEAMWLMLQQEKPDDYVVATGETHSVQEFLERAFLHLGLDWKRYVKTDARYMRPSEVNVLCGDYSKAHRTLGWSPRVRFPDLVTMMVDADLRLAEEEIRAKGAPA